MKKRWVLLLLALSVAVGAVALSGPSESMKVTTTMLRATRVEQTISCTGVVESAESTGVSLPFPCVMKRVEVKEGTRVKKGDLLAVVDKQATADSLGEESQRLVLAATAERITAPQDGVVIAVNAQEGVMLEQGMPCVLLALEKDLQVRVNLREKDLQVLRQGQTVRLSGDGFARPMYYGRLTEIAAAARTDTGAGTVVDGVVKLDEGQSDDSLRLGLTARAAVVTAVTEQGLVVPHEAVLNDAQGYYVFLLRAGHAQREPISVVGQVATGVLLSDLSLEGETVICQPGKIIEDGLPVQEDGK